MEELRSTDALDREILEDARRKAEKALRAADQTALEVSASWDKKLAGDIAALERKHAQRIAALRTETFARFPLDQRRVRVQRAEKLLSESMDEFLRSLPRQRKLAVLERELFSRSPELSGDGELAVRAEGLKEAEARAVLARALGDCAFSLQCVPGDDEKPSLVAERGRTSVRCGIARLGEDLLRENRAGLASALLGPEVVND